MARFEVIESKHWRNADTGATASIYGANPYRGDTGAWAIETRGWTIRDNKNGTVGMCRKPFASRDDAAAFAAQCEERMNPANVAY